MSSLPTHSVRVACANAIEGHAAHDFNPADGQSDPDAVRLCTACDAVANMRCPTCGTSYCDRVCYRNDWSTHKILCNELKNNFAPNKCPSNSVRAIVFPVGSEKPSWAWVNLNTFDVSVIKTLGITEKKAFKNPKNKLAVRDINQELKHRKVGHGIRQFTVPNARVDGLNINRSILALADPGHLKVYFGAAVFFGFRTAEVGGQTKVFYEDCTTRDLRMIIDWYMIQRDNPCVSKLTRYPTEIYSEPGQPRLSFVPAVKINCEGDILRLSSLTGQGMDMVEDVWVLNKDQLNNRHAAQLPAMAGLPWLVQPCSCFGSYDHLVDKDNVGILRNWVGRVFMTDAKQPFPASHMTIGPNNTLPENLDATHCGTIIIMHANARHINTLHVAAFYEFVERVFATVPTRFHRDQVDKGSQRVLTETFELEKLIRKDHFERFWLVWAEARIGIVGELCTSPYNDHLAAVAVSAEMGACLEVVSVEEAKEARKEAESLLSEEV